MAPPPPHLMEELVAEVLLRLPPAEPASLFRASAVSRAWNHLICDHDALHRYRQHHAPPPLLGFFQNPEAADDLRSRFVPTSDPAPPFFAEPTFEHVHWMVLDSRHGRVLVHTVGPLNLLVWNPINNHLEVLEVPQPPELFPEYGHFTGAVLCAVNGCDHLDCAGGPFRVVFSATASEDVDEVITWASSYSSETGEWTEPTTIHPGPVMNLVHVMGPSLLVGDALYFSLDLFNRRAFLVYHLGDNTMSVVEGPLMAGHGVFPIAAEDGAFGVAAVEENELHLWARAVGDVGAWARRKIISVGSITSHVAVNAIRVVGYAEDADCVFLSTNNGVFVVDLKSDMVKKVSDLRCLNPVLPFASFFTRGLGAGLGAGHNV